MKESPGRVQYLELTPTEFRQRMAKAPIAYLPLGTLEWHGEHLPLGADALQSHGFFLRLAEEVGGIVLPPLFLGPDKVKEVQGRTYIGMDHWTAAPGQERVLEGSAYWVDDELFSAMLTACLTQLSRAGFRIVVGHGHGPSTEAFARHSPRWERTLGLRLFTCRRAEEEEKDGSGLMADHAAMNETSLTMALRPELVHMEYQPADLSLPLVAVWGKDPRGAASAREGERILRLLQVRMAALLRSALEQIAEKERA